MMRAAMLFIPFLTILALRSSHCPAPRMDAELTWEAPTTNEDGTPLTDLAGYRILYGRNSERLDLVADVGNVTRANLAGLPGWTWHFEAMAYDEARNVSRPSNRVEKTIFPLATIPFPGFPIPP